MDQSTHEIRRINWMNIINQCKNRPADMTANNGLQITESAINLIITGFSKFV